MRRIFLPLFALISLLAGAQVLDLSGVWSVQIDSLDNGPFAGDIRLPGTLDMAGIGNPNTLEPKLEKPQMLRLTRKVSYIGSATYTRDIEISKAMAGKPLEFEFERVLWKSQLYVDGHQVADFQESLTTPHRFVLPQGLKAGRHLVTLVIDNRMQHDISDHNLAHSYTNDTQTMWNGVLGSMTVRVLQQVAISDLQVYPDVASMSARVVVTLDNSTGKSAKADLNFQVDGGRSVSKSATVAPGSSTVEAVVSMDGAALWSEFSPVLQHVTVTCRADKSIDIASATFGMRSVEVGEGTLLVNGNRVFLRGTLECCIFPLTGTPPTDEAGWEKVFTTARSYGLNHLRFHSWCPPEAAFRVADKMGFYVQVELPQWSLIVGKDEATNKFLYDEFDRISRAYGNHPSFVLMTCGNELQPDFDFLNDLVRYMKGRDSRHLYSCSSFTFEKGHGGHAEPEDQFLVTQWTDNGWVRGQGVFDTEYPSFNKNYDKATRALTVPLITHEIGQYAVYPNIREIDKYTGTLDPINFKAVRNDLVSKGLIDKADDWLYASGRLAALLYKEEIERALKTSGISGFQLLDLHDFPGQGTALVGLLDAFWDSKGIIGADEFRQFCSPVVPLAYFGSPVFTSGDTIKAKVALANYGPENLVNQSVDWQIADAYGAVFASGAIAPANFDNGAVSDAGWLQAVVDTTSPRHLTLKVSVPGTQYANSWPIWVYPANLPFDEPKGLITSDIDEAISALDAGRNVLLTPNYKQIVGLDGKFVPVFWSPIHFPKQAGTMGLLCNPAHPALRHFPTDSHTNWQWWDLLKHSKAVNLDNIAGATPIVEQVDNFVNNRRLASVFEAKCGNGKLIFSAIDLLRDDKPERVQLLRSLATYLDSDYFDPQGTVDPSQLRALVTTPKTSTDTPTSIYE